MRVVAPPGKSAAAVKEGLMWTPAGLQTKPVRHMNDGADHRLVDGHHHDDAG